jgi:hypothetical protein
MGKKYPLEDFKHTNKYSPSPDKYAENLQFNRHVLSNFKSMGDRIINPDNGKLDRGLIDVRYVSNIPGPSDYEIGTVTSINKHGVYHI